MALLKNFVTLKLSRCKACVVATQRYSQYAPSFQEPTYKVDELNVLYEEGGHVDKSFRPIKAAKSTDSNSIFRDDLLNTFINIVMEQGKKQLARGLLEKTFFNIKMTQIANFHKAPPEEKDSIEMDPLKLFHIAIGNCKPLLDMTRIKRGAIMYNVPIAISDKFSTFKAMRWLKDAAQDKHRKIHFPEKLAAEILDAAQNQGRVVKRKQEWHKQCEANKAYAHYRWG